MRTRGNGSGCVTPYILRVTGVDVRYALITHKRSSGNLWEMALILATRVSKVYLKQAKERLHDFIIDYPEFSDCIQTVLSSGCRIDVLFPDEVREHDLDKIPRINPESVLLADIYAGCF